MTPRQQGLNPRALGLNPRATKSNPRATSDNPRADDTILVRIVAPHFVAGLTVFTANGCVSRTPSILQWAQGKPIREVLAYAHKKGWKSEVLANA